MGIQDRDYYRDRSGSLLEAWGRQGAVVWLIVITSVVFFAQCLSGGPIEGELTQFGVFSAARVMEGEVWRLITPLFLHVGLWGLFWNMLVLYWAGSRMEELYGPREFLCYYLVGGFGIHLLYLLVILVGLSAPQIALGPSPVITAVFVLFALHYPHERILLFFIIPVPVWLLAVFYVASSLMGVLAPMGGKLIFIGQLTGAGLALLVFQTGFRFTNLVDRLPARRRPQLRLLPREEEPSNAEPVGAAVESQPRESVDEHLEAKLDRILEKVSQHGQESLTAEERDILVRASELYKKRRK